MPLVDVRDPRYRQGGRVREVGPGRAPELPTSHICCGGEQQDIIQTDEVVW